MTLAEITLRKTASQMDLPHKNFLSPYWLKFTPHRQPKSPAIPQVMHKLKKSRSLPVSTKSDLSHSVVPYKHDLLQNIDLMVPREQNIKEQFAECFSIRDRNTDRVRSKSPERISESGRNEPSDLVTTSFNFQNGFSGFRQRSSEISTECKQESLDANYDGISMAQHEEKVHFKLAQPSSLTIGEQVLSARNNDCSEDRKGSHFEYDEVPSETVSMPRNNNQLANKEIDLSWQMRPTMSFEEPVIEGSFLRTPALGRAIIDMRTRGSTTTLQFATPRSRLSSGKSTSILEYEDAMSVYSTRSMRSTGTVTRRPASALEYRDSFENSQSGRSKSYQTLATKDLNFAFELNKLLTNNRNIGAKNYSIMVVT